MEKIISALALIMLLGAYAALIVRYGFYSYVPFLRELDLGFFSLLGVTTSMGLYNYLAIMKIRKQINKEK